MINFFFVKNSKNTHKRTSHSVNLYLAYKFHRNKKSVLRATYPVSYSFILFLEQCFVSDVLLNGFIGGFNKNFTSCKWEKLYSMERYTIEHC